VSRIRPRQSAGTALNKARSRSMQKRPIGHALTRLGEWAAHPAAFGLALLYAVCWLIFDRESLNWHGATELIVLCMTLVYCALRAPRVSGSACEARSSSAAPGRRPPRDHQDHPRTSRNTARALRRRRTTDDPLLSNPGEHRMAAMDEGSQRPAPPWLLMTDRQSLHNEESQKVAVERSRLANHPGFLRCLPHGNGLASAVEAGK
jgi:hypothetical protein